MGNISGDGLWKYEKHKSILSSGSRVFSLFQFQKEFSAYSPVCICHTKFIEFIFKIYRKLRSGRVIWGGLSYLVQSILVNEKFDLRRTNRHSPDPLILKAYILSLMD